MCVYRVFHRGSSFDGLLEFQKIRGAIGAMSLGMGFEYRGERWRERRLRARAYSISFLMSHLMCGVSGSDELSWVLAVHCGALRCAGYPPVPIITVIEPGGPGSPRSHTHTRLRLCSCLPRRRAAPRVAGRALP